MPQKTKKGIKKKGGPKRWKDFHSTKLKIRVLGNEVFIVYVSSDMTVEELRKLVELATGIPYDLQRLTYLDEAELVDSTTMKENEIVPGGAIDLSVWHMWLDLVEKAIMGEIAEVLKLGVSSTIPFSSPITEYMDEETKLAWLKNRAFVVFCIAAHRDNIALCEEMIPFVENVNARTPLGRTVLHLASSQGKCEMIKYLLEKGCRLHVKDYDNLKALDLAALFGRMDAERLLFMAAWKEKRERKNILSKTKESSKSSKKEEDAVSELIPENQVTISVETTTVDTKEKPETMAKTLTTPNIKISISSSPGDDAVKQTKMDEALVKVEELKSDISLAEDETKVSLNVPLMVSDNRLPTGYSRDPDSFRHYLLNLKKQSKNFGYAASVIDNHLQRLDDVRYHSFHRKTLVSEDDMNEVTS